MLTYKFNYKINACTYRFNYAYCDRMITKDNTDISLNYNPNLIKNTISKNYISNIRNIMRSFKDDILEINKYSLFYLKDYNLSKHYNLLNIQQFKNLLNLKRLILSNSSILLSRNNIKNIDILSIFLLYRHKPNMTNDSLDKFLNYPFPRLIDIVNDYFFNRQFNSIIFKPSLNTLYRPFKELYFDSLTYNLNLQQRLIHYIKDLKLFKVYNELLLKCNEIITRKGLDSLINDFISIITDIGELSITNISDIYLNKNTRYIFGLINIIGVYKDFKPLEDLISIHLNKDTKYIFNSIDILSSYKDLKDIYLDYNKYLDKDFKPLELLFNIYLNKEAKDTFKINTLELIKDSKYINITETIYLDKYFKPLFIDSDLVNLEVSSKQLDYLFIDKLLTNNLKFINHLDILKLINLSNKSINFNKLELNICRNVKNIAPINQEKSLNVLQRLLFYCNDISTVIGNKNISIEKLLYLFSKYFKDINLLNIDTLNAQDSLDSLVLYSSFLLNSTSKDIKLDINNEHELKLWQRFWFLLPKGQTDNLILPNCDYPYEDKSIEGIDKHPIQAGKDIAIGEIPLSINIMIDLINILIFMWCKFYNAFWGCTGSQAVLDTVMYVYEWLNLETSIDEQVRKGSKEHYDRCYRWLRWEAEKVILMARNDTKLNGNYYVQVLIENLIQYMLDHHFDVMPIFKDIERMDEWRNILNSNVENDIDWVINKLKGIRHKTLEKLKEEL